MIDETGTWYIPPVCGGQIVEVAYRLDGEGNRLYRRITDKSPSAWGPSTWRAWSPLEEGDEPWNTDPDYPGREWTDYKECGGFTAAAIGEPSYCGGCGERMCMHEPPEPLDEGRCAAMCSAFNECEEWGA